MSFFGRAWRYVIRKRVKTLVILGILTALGTVLVATSAISGATDKAAAEVEAKTGAGFVLGNNPQFNMGTPRGAGNVKGKDIAKIAALEGIDSYNARQNVVADLVDANIQKLSSDDYDETKEAQFGNAANVWGVNNTQLDNSFRSGALRLVAGRHLNADDHYKSVINEDLAQANGLTIGSKLKLRANPYDADNTSKSTSEVETEIVGLVSGSNAAQARSRSELYANTVFTDLDTTRELYQMNAENEIYQDANFFVAKDANFEQVANAAASLDIDWRNYQLSRSNQYLAGITGGISGVRSILNSTKIATLVFAVALLSLVLILWLNERKKETGVLLSMGTSKASIVAQYLVELAIIGLPALGLAFFGARGLAQGLGNAMLTSANKSIIQQAQQAGQMGSDMESSMATRTLDSLGVHVSIDMLIQVGLLMAVVILVAVAATSIPMLKKSPKALLVASR